jgi:hypothetical protein
VRAAAAAARSRDEPGRAPGRRRESIDTLLDELAAIAVSEAQANEQ